MGVGICVRVTALAMTRLRHMRPAASRGHPTDSEKGTDRQLPDPAHLNIARGAPPILSLETRAVPRRWPLLSMSLIPDHPSDSENGTDRQLSDPAHLNVARGAPPSFP